MHTHTGADEERRKNENNEGRGVDTVVITFMKERVNQRNTIENKRRVRG
jgi:hypothetical protein